MSVAAACLRPLVTIDYLNTASPKYEAMLKNLKTWNRPFAVEMAGEIKDSLRQRYGHIENQYEPHSAQECRLRSGRFWRLYELVNRVLDEDDPVYSVVNEGATLSTTADTLTWQAASAGQLRILEIIIGGEATASAVNRIAVQRSGSSITGNTPITPEKFNTRSGGASGTYGKAGTQALVGGSMLTFAINAFGGYTRWVAQPGEEMYALNSEVISLRSSSGTSVFTATGVFEEL